MGSRSRRFFPAIAVASLVALVGPASASAAEVSIAVPNYATGQATAHAVKHIIRQALGLEAELVPISSYPGMWRAMSRGDGQIDIMTDVWLPTQGELVKKYVEEEQTAHISDRSVEGRQGFCATRATVEEYGIRTVFDLSNPDNVALLDSDGNGRGEFYIGPPGWLAANINRVKARDYGLTNFYDLVSADEAIATAGIDEAITSGQPWVGYCYAPHQNFARYDLEWIQEPAYAPEDFVYVAPKDDPNWMEESNISSAFPPQTVNIAWSADLAERQPLLAHLLSQIQYTVEDVNNWNLAITNGQDPDQIASQWVDAHSDLIAQWMSE